MPPPPPTALALDSFARTVTGGWGTAEVGGSWGPTGPSFSVANGVGTIRSAAAGSGPVIYLNAVSAQNVTGTVDIAMDKPATGGGSYGTMLLRHQRTSDYRIKLHFLAGGGVQVMISKVLSGAETALRSFTVAGLRPAIVYACASP